jgi:hypothetical protein
MYVTTHLPCIIIPVVLQIYAVVINKPGGLVAVIHIKFIMVAAIANTWYNKDI